MNSTFTGINIASRGIYASQAAISVVTNNMSNVHTEGYSRQIANQSTIGVGAVYGGRPILGNGSEVTSVGQLRDSRLDQRYWQENTRLGGWNEKAKILTELESVMNVSASGIGFSKVFNKFYSDLETLSKNPGASTTRNAVKESGKAVCQYLNETSQKLMEMRKDANCAVNAAVDGINSYAGQIASLNGRISQALAAGGNANDLKDQRNVLVDKLSKLIDISVTQTENNKFIIRVNGRSLVDDGDVKALKVEQDSTKDGMYSIKWKDTGDAFVPTDGQLKAKLDLRDGDGANSSFKGIPYYSNQLDKYAQTFAEAFNEGILAGGDKPYGGHAGGVGLNGSKDIRFFSYNGISSDKLKEQIGKDGAAAVYKQITAATISLSKEIVEDVSNIAASKSGKTEDAENVSQLIKLLKDSSMFNKGTPEDFYNSIISTLGTESSTAQRSSTNAASLIKTINDRRTSVSGVDINEETASMTKYQQAYEANSKMVSVWSQIYARTIDMVNG